MRFAIKLLTSVGQDRLILTRSGAGAPELQRWARNGFRKHPHFTVGRGPVPRRAAIAAEIETGRSLLPMLLTVGRGPVPRRAATAAKTEIIPFRKNSQNGVWGTLGMARDRPSPYGMRGVFFTVARGPVPRDLSLSPGIRRGTGPRPTAEERLF